MKPVITENTDVNFILPGGTDENDLPAYRMFDSVRQPTICSVWQPTPEERVRLAAGENVRLVIWGTGQPPVAIDVTDERVIEGV